MKIGFYPNMSFVDNVQNRMKLFNKLEKMV